MTKHGNATFCCIYNGTTVLPTWRINNTEYSINEIIIQNCYEVQPVTGELHGVCLFIRNVTQNASVECLINLENGVQLISQVGYVIWEGKFLHCYCHHGQLIC